MLMVYNLIMRNYFLNLLKPGSKSVSTLGSSNSFVAPVASATLIAQNAESSTISFAPNYSILAKSSDRHPNNVISHDFGNKNPVKPVFSSVNEDNKNEVFDSKHLSAAEINLHLTELKRSEMEVKNQPNMNIFPWNAPQGPGL